MKDNEYDSFERTEWLHCPLCFTFMLALENRQHFMSLPLVSLWNDGSLSTQMELLHLLLTHFVDKISGGLANCWLFSHAFFMLAN